MLDFKVFFFIIFLFFISCEDKDIKYNIFKYNETSSITSLDPIFANNQANIWATNQLFNSLTFLDDSLNVQPLIAKRWSVSKDGLKYTFFIRDDIYYHKSICFGPDSTRLLVASDFIYSISRLIDKNNISPGAWVMDYINYDQTVAINDTVLELTLNKPFPGILGLLSMSYFSFVPHEAIQYFGTSFSYNPVGTGPFYFKYWRQNDKMIFRKNLNYFEYENNIRLPHLDGVSISFITQKESVFMNFITGNFDFVSGLDNSFKDEFLDFQGQLLPEYQSKFQLMTNPYLNTEYLGINIPKSKIESSPLASKSFRKALNYSFDRVMMTKYLRNGLVIPAHKGFVPDILSDCYDVKGFSYLPDTVRHLLENVYNKNDQITLHTTQDYLDLCEYIQYNASKFGINLNIEISSPAVHRKLVSSSDVSLFRASWIGDYPDPENFLSLFYSKNKSPFGPNYTHFDHHIYDSLYELSFSVKNFSDRCELFSKMEAILIEESVIIPLYYDYVVRLVSNKIHGMSINSMNTLSLKNVQKR